MDIIIGGLIVLSILSTPVDKLTSNLIQSGILSLKNRKNIVKEENKKNITTEDISNILSEIDENFVTINSLKKQKIEAKINLDKKMQSLIKSKINLTENQMTFFQNYSKLISDEETKINYYDEKLNDKKEFILLQNDILSKSNNLHIIYEKLSIILKYQLNIIASLYKSIFNLKSCVEIL